MEFIKTEIKDQIGTIIFNNDSKRNSFNSKMLHESLSALKLFSQEKIRAVVIKSNTATKVWSAGFYINELPDAGKDPLPFNHPFEELMREIEDFDAPVIAMINGSVWGGACDLAFSCDILIGSKNSTFAITPAKIGVPYNTTGIQHFLNIMEMNIAKEMLFTAKPISAERAYNLGILNHLIEKDKLEAFTYEMAKTIASNSPLSVSVIKKQLNLLGKARPMNAEVFEQVHQLRKIAYNSYDFKEGKKAFIEKRLPNFKGI